MESLDNGDRSGGSEDDSSTRPQGLPLNPEGDIDWEKVYEYSQYYDLPSFAQGSGKADADAEGLPPLTPEDDFDRGRGW